MNSLIKLLFAISVSLILSNCSNNTNKPKIDTYEDIKKELKGVELEKIKPVADIDALESEINNGGFNQYFFNSSGQNCFETLRALKRSGKNKTAEILETAIHLINPDNLPEEQLLEKIRKRQVQELDDSTINKKLDSLDQQFYKYPDGSLK